MAADAASCWSAPPGQPGTTPAAAGYAMPAEWTPHAGCLMQWPARSNFWPDLAATQAAYVAVARAIAQFEPVTVVAGPTTVADARAQLRGAAGVLELPIDDAWARDSGPTFVRHRSGQLGACLWHFNAWGEKHPDYALDAALGAALCDHYGAHAWRAPVVFEGGALHVDGEGTVLTTDSVILNPNRNPGLSRPDAESVLREGLGVEHVVWTPGDPGDEETDGHVDTTACFAAPGLVLMNAASSRSARHAPLRAQRDALERQQDARGRRFEVVEIEEASGSQARVCRSYVNFYVANGGIVAPSYCASTDDAARSTLQEVFPGREVVMVDARAVGAGGGSVHCITQQVPG